MSVMRLLGNELQGMAAASMLNQSSRFFSQFSTSPSSRRRSWVFFYRGGHPYRLYYNVHADSLPAVFPVRRSPLGPKTTGLDREAALELVTAILHEHRHARGRKVARPNHPSASCPCHYRLITVRVPGGFLDDERCNGPGWPS